MRYTHKDSREWKEQAQKTLEVAQDYCHRANASLNKAVDEIGQLPSTIDHLEALIGGLEGSVERSARIIELLRTEGSFSPSEEEILQVRTAFHELDEIVSVLHTVKVPEREKTLADFISIDAISTLKHNFGVYEGNHKIIGDFLEKRIQRSWDALFGLEKHAVKLREQFSDRVIPLKVQLKSKDLPATRILKENASLEHELVSILEMLTNHLDQCTQAEQHFAEHTQDNLDILYNDTLELNDVLKGLQDVCDIIFTNEARLDKTFGTELRHIDTLARAANTHLDSLYKTKATELPQLVALVAHFRSSKGEMELGEYLESARSLTYHYTQFVDVYRTEYLKELHYEKHVYPKLFLDKVNEFIHGELQSMQAAELERRRKWLARFGAFLPREMDLPGERGLPGIKEVMERITNEVSYE